ncbi:tRNA pseudouridine(13) synthase TruD [archaeon]|nr:tRNA pseudouridine(13) synthase TruD [archaeon]|tara:strand:+ start:381 stop:1439 length:1059 start_codon:yes stop_codon:yes gene_type:complete
MIIKEKAEDFRVEEIYTKIPEGKEYCIFILDKKNWTSLKALEKIAKRMKLSVKRFNIAGQKDRRGVTRQYVSCQGIGKRDLERVRLKDIKLEFVCYSCEPIKLGKLDGNKFKIVVRETKGLKKVDHFPNYYDDQRFGGFRPNLHLVGKEVLLENYEKAVKLMLLYPFEEESDDYKEARKYMEENWGDWVTFDMPKGFVNERKIVGYLEKNDGDYLGALKSLPRHLFSMIPQAYQSYIFNVSLSRHLEKYNCVEKKYALGELCFCKEYIDIDWPIVGYESKGNEIIEEVMKEEGVWYDTFKHEVSKLSSKGLFRKAMVKVDVKLGELNKGKQKVEFFLPPGSYATMVLKALDQ